MECIEYWCNFINHVSSSSREISFLEFFVFMQNFFKSRKMTLKAWSTVSKTLPSVWFFCTLVGWLIWGLESTAWVFVGQRGKKEPNTYFSAFFTTLDSSLEVEAAFTSLFLLSSPLSHVLLWERSIPPRFALLPLQPMQITQEKTCKDFIRKGSDGRKAEKRVEERS